MRTRTIGGALALGLLIAAGCGGDDAPDPGPNSGPGSSLPAGPPASFAPGARSGPNPPAITGYQVPPAVSCTPGQPVSVPVSYQTTGAMTVTFTVGTDQVEGYPPLSGTFPIPLPCDGNAHTIVLFAVAADMSTNTESKAVMTGS